MATLSQVAKPNAADLDALYGPLAAPLREALGFGGQNDIDMLAPSRVNEQGGEGGSGGAYLKPSPALQAMIDAGQVGYGNLQMHDPSAQSEMGYWVNWDKMPQTAFGKPGGAGAGGMPNIAGYSPSMDDILYNRNAVTKDPNFGYVTPAQNVNLHASKWEELGYNAGPALAMAIMTMGAGLPSMMTAGPRALQSATNGDWGGLLSSAAGAFGVPSWATGAANTAYGLARGRKPNPVSTGMSLANIINNVTPGG
jgi:hypothetical protein